MPLRPLVRPATGPAGASAARLRRLAESVAARLQWMTLDFIYDRPPELGPDAAEVAALWASLHDPPTSPVDRSSLLVGTDGLQPGPWSADDIRPLLRHADAKVRTLGVMLLYQLNRVDVLPDIAALQYDAAQTFPSPAMLATSVPAGKWPMQPASVADFARAVIATYVEKSVQLTDIAAPSPGRVSRGAVAEFAAERDPTLCTPALRVALQRATGGMTPLQNGRRDRVDAVLGLLQQVPMPRRFFVALALDFQENAGDRYSPDLLDLAREVPRDVRLRVLCGEPAIDDPDLARGYGYEYLLAHVTDLFRGSDADLFLRMADDRLTDRDEQQVADELAAPDQVAAARLRPADADGILGRAMDRLGDRHDGSADQARSTLALAMARFGGEPSLRRAVDWFFTMRPEPGSVGGGREGLMGAVAAESPARARLLYERLIRDPRLDRLGPYSTRLLIQAVQGYLGRSLAADDDLRAAYGDEAQRDGPFKSLAAWHQALRITVDEWSR